MKHNLGWNKINEKIKNPQTQIKDDVLVYHCVPYASIGRTISYLVKRFKRQDIKAYKSIVIENIQDLVFKRDPSEAISKYKRFYLAGNQTKGHFTPKSCVGLFNKLLRNNLKYKTTQKELYRKICILRKEQYEYLVKKKVLGPEIKNLCESDFVYKLRQNHYGLKIKLKDLISKL